MEITNGFSTETRDPRWHFWQTGQQREPGLRDPNGLRIPSQLVPLLMVGYWTLSLIAFLNRGKLSFQPRDQVIMSIGSQLWNSLIMLLTFHTTGLYGYGTSINAVGIPTFFFTIMDQVEVPKDLDTGDYVLSFRWDCEQTPQVWNTCADVKIVPWSYEYNKNLSTLKCQSQIQHWTSRKT